MPLSYHNHATALSPPSSKQELRNIQFTHCGRSDFTTDFDDWITLATDNNIAICPQCFETTIAPFPHWARNFVKAQSNAFPSGVACDMTRWWARWLFRWLQVCGPEVDMSGLLSTVANAQDSSGLCPNGDAMGEARREKEVAVRAWYCVRDSSGQLLDDFTLCGFCLQKIHALWPAVAHHRIFEVAADGMLVAATCDLVYGSDRTNKVLVLLCHMVYEADNRALDKSQLVAFIKKYAHLAECNGPNGAIAKRHGCRYIEDFDVCETCYEDHVKELQGSRMASLLDETAVLATQGFVCDMFSEKVKELWKLCAASDDANTFITRYTERLQKREQIRTQFAMLDIQAQQCLNTQKQFLDMANMEIVSEGSKMISSGWADFGLSGGSSSYVPDYSRRDAFQRKAWEQVSMAQQIDFQRQALEREWEIWA